MKRALLAIVISLAPAASHAADRGYFNCMHLTEEQRHWFASPGVSNCCNLADGMPVRFEERPTGTFIPPYEVAYYEAVACRDNESHQFGSPLAPLKEGEEEDRSAWIKVEPDKELKKTNPIGVGVVWWANAGYPASEEHQARCFVGLIKV